MYEVLYEILSEFLMALVGQTIGQYTLTALIQETQNSIVYESSHPTSCLKLAVKLLKKSGMSEEQFNNELEVNQEISNPYLMPIIGIVNNVPDEFYCAIVMKKANGCDLMQLILDNGRLNENVAAQVAYAGLKALQYLHENGICHRDVKPDNFFLMDDDKEKLDIVLADFGQATHFQEKMSDYTIGTPVYVAPEILTRTKYDESIDIWSLGCVIYLCLSGYYTFNDPAKEDPENIQMALYTIIVGDYTLEDDPWPQISQPAKDFVRSMIQVNPEDRASIESLLRHEWLASNYVEYNKQIERIQRMQEELNNNQNRPELDDDYYM